MSNAENVDVGGKLKKLRQVKGISLKAAAEATGMSYSYLWGLEHSKHSISIANLQRLSEFFNVDLVYFFKTASQGPVSLVGRDDTTTYHTQDGLRFNLITSGRSKNMQVMEVYHPPHTPSERRVYCHDQEGEEFITVLEGKLFVMVEDTTYELEKGDPIMFSSSMRHSIYTEDLPARFLLVASPPYGDFLL
ncbi:MAG: XRE family transcriptional regulator [Clostridia bacterium]|nr:XRE family transcriptional regulator [Clostridia bacterium]